tara:strand:+ start:691 stop:2313 length:1623 start_codon:yes stop_codon:yes gene_type:complete
MFKIKSISKYFFSIFNLSLDKLRNSYFKTSFYNQKISKEIPSKYIYKPSPHIINCLVFFKKKKKIENLHLSSIWKIDSNNQLEFKNLHNFLWLNTLDIKTSRVVTHNIIEDWIENNINFNEQTWKTEILSKRIIAWISNTNLTLESSNPNYRKKFNFCIIKQINHLFNNINNEKNYEIKIIGCASLILIGLVFIEYKKFKEIGLEILKKIIKINFDYNGFPKSRNLEELTECLKYLILIREWIKESQNLMPEFLDEIIYNLGISYNFINKNFSHTPLFNGSSSISNEEFKMYLTNAGYSFKHNFNERGGYYITKNKKISFIMDIGNSTEKKFSRKYQAGCLSFEIVSGDNKLICNSGFYYKKNNRLTTLCKSTAAHSTLYIDNHSSCTLDKSNVKKGLEIISKKINIEKDFDRVIASHNGYQKKYGYLHEREIKFFKKKQLFIGKDSLIAGRKATKVNFGIRFHVHPETKVVKTQNSTTVLLSMSNGDGWKFTCSDYELIIEKGIYLGNKNKLNKNENIFISGIAEQKDLFINWTFEKIS